MGAPGCDDAPYVDVPLCSQARDVTLIMPYYENPVFLGHQMRHFNDLPEDLRAHLSVIIVDDGSPRVPAYEVLKSVTPGFSLRLYRLMVDVRWNWLAARNIGAHHAKTAWLLITDMDHVVPPGTLRGLVFGTHDTQTIYRFSRRESTGVRVHPHPNSWFYTRTMYWKVGGHDEALSGHYGTDGEYRRRCAATAPIRILNSVLERHERIGDSSTTHYLRKQPEDAAVKRIINSRPINWRPKTLSFPYSEEVLTCCR